MGEPKANFRSTWWLHPQGSLNLNPSEFPPLPADMLFDHTEQMERRGAVGKGENKSSHTFHCANPSSGCETVNRSNSQIKQSLNTTQRLDKIYFHLTLKQLGNWETSRQPHQRKYFPKPFRKANFEAYWLKAWEVAFINTRKSATDTKVRLQAIFTSMMHHKRLISSCNYQRTVKKMNENSRHNMRRWWVRKGQEAEDWNIRWREFGLIF